MGKSGEWKLPESRSDRGIAHPRDKQERERIDRDRTGKERHQIPADARDGLIHSVTLKSYVPLTGTKESSG